jgi:hypothetical protein
MYHSTLGLRVIKKKKKGKAPAVNAHLDAHLVIVEGQLGGRE